MQNQHVKHRLERQHKQAATGGRPFEYLATVNGTKVIITDHAKARAVQRLDVPLAQLQDFFKRGAAGMQTVLDTVVEYNQEVFVFSRHYQRGMILAIRADYKATGINEMCFVVVTVYPYGKSRPLKPDTEVFYV